MRKLLLLALLAVTYSGMAQERQKGDIFNDSRGRFYMTDETERGQKISFYLGKGVMVDGKRELDLECVYRIPGHLVDSTKTYRAWDQNGFRWKIPGQYLRYLHGESTDASYEMSTDH